jgi:hypothetical protein
MLPITKKYNGFSRGEVLDNTGKKGCCKIFVPGVYPQKFAKDASSLPWSEPAMPVFGGSFTNSKDGQNEETGMTSPPHVGANVWVFFENADQNYPVYCFAIQGGDGWLSEHPNQHVIQTDNVRIRIDEDPSNSDSTTQFDSYNKGCTYLSKPSAVDAIPTRLDIEVTGPTNIILSSNLENDEAKPALNVQINGTVYTEINGAKHETINGTHFVQHNGDYHLVRTGDTLIELTGNQTEKITGNYITTVGKNNELYVRKNNTHSVIGSENISVGVSQTQTIASRQLVVTGSNNLIVNGTQNTFVGGLNVESYAVGCVISSNGTIAIASSLGTSIKSTGEIVVNGLLIRLN